MYKKLIPAILISTSLFLCACQPQPSAVDQNMSSLASYEIKMDLTGWKLANVQNDPGGYFKTYQPINPKGDRESILFNYGKGITTSLDASLQQVVAVEKNLPCSVFNYKILSRTANSLSF